MSVELLRRAAKVLRDNATKATEGPWTYTESSEDDEAIGSPTELVYSHYAADDTGINIGPLDGQYIALMHPPVALALADWLEHEAEGVERHHRVWSLSPDVPDADAHVEAMFAHGLDVAREILREES